MIYKFIGEDGSMGLFNGNKYDLIIRWQTDGQVITDVILANYVSPNSKMIPTLFIPYDSKVKFNENWERVDQ